MQRQASSGVLDPAPTGEVMPGTTKRLANSLCRLSYRAAPWNSGLCVLAPTAFLSEPGDKWDGNDGFINQVGYDNYLAKHPGPECCDYYLCGASMMLQSSLSMLDELGVAAENINYDDFGIRARREIFSMITMVLAIPLFVFAIGGLALHAVLRRRSLGGSCGHRTQCLVRGAGS